MDIREALTLLEAAQGFRLHPALDPANYQITDSLRDAENWQAMTYDGNSGGTEKGQIGPVGYIMISTVDNTLIPISRGDEHHQGYDTLYDLVRKKKMDINPRNYVAVFWAGRNYIYSTSEIKPWLTALSKWLKWGGKDGYLIGANDLRKTMMTYSDFVAAKGNITIKPGELASFGKQVIGVFKMLADALEAARASDKPSAQAAAFNAALKTIKFFSDNSYEAWKNGVETDDLKALVQKVRDLKKADDLQGLTELFFGFNGLKNTIHNALRETQRNMEPGGKRGWNDDDRVAMWGDINLAVDMLGRF